jgi:hypothetical protein
VILATGDWAYVAVGVAVPLFGFLGLWFDGRRRDRRIDELHNEVRSPNGTNTGELTYESAKRLVEIREQMVEIREAQLHGWRHNDQVAARIEQKVDQIAVVQETHLDRDDARFGAIFATLELADPIPDVT